MCQSPQCRHFLDADRRDPTGTTGIRKDFERDAVRRFKSVRRQIIEAVVTQDVFGISKPILGFGDATPPKSAYGFAKLGQKVEMFMGWLRGVQDETILEVRLGEPVTAGSWFTKHVRAAYGKGARDAAARLRQAGAKVAPSWLSGLFGRKAHADRVELAFTRTFTDLQGVTEVMNARISRALAEGLARGDGPAIIARTLAKQVDTIGIVRARAIARTETIRAHADATLNSYQEAGVGGVDAVAEFTTAGDGSVCEECAGLEGKTYSISEARGVIPVHVNCRCSWSPAVVNGTDIELV